MSSTRAGPGMPPGTSSGHSVATTRQAAPALSCNLCNKPLVTTCFLCACDCVFCEECTYSHFENSSQCPTCRRTLGENDFTELVVADNNGSDISKMSMQALFFEEKQEWQPAVFGYMSEPHPADRRLKAKYEILAEATTGRIAQIRTHEHGRSESAGVA
mmetsp:Transcript_4906/g.10835  ORF Transcript_4906/g.10835 Transcript_4906/m.10835 type:complete len:159 (+) Transcript_4906:340-816(+)